ncbi:MAG: AAA family ATPase [Cyanobacteriota bacterium]|nr:AAA family ATPase [Cyanobacteriota bacterium]
MSSLAGALLDSLRRLLPPAGSAADQALLEPVITALVAAQAQGELGLDLAGPPPEALVGVAWPQGMLEALAATGWLLSSEELAAASDPAALEAPLVRDGSWLRWRRWHEQLQQCLEQLLNLAQAQPEPPMADALLAQTRAMASAAGLDAAQCEAAAAVLRHRLVLLRGGPGTGKTSTVVQMLAAAVRHQPQLQIHLAAPTGKAAARLGAAVSAGAAGLETPLAAALQALPCTTLHRLLEARGAGRFGRHGRRPLQLDLLVVDEVSMVDLPLMQALLEALPKQARLLLVGDADQLPPVGTGAVLAELCRPARLQRLGPAAVELRTTYRNNGAIADLAGCLRGADPAQADPAEALLPRLARLSSSDNVQWWPSDPARLPEALLDRLRQHQQRLRRLAAELSWPADREAEPDAASCAPLLAALEQCIALSPVRQGRWGIDALHRALLGPSDGVPLQRWPLGTPVLNRLNRPEQGLANGDIGVLVQRGAERWVLLEGPRLLHPSRLALAEPALALTVHKAQGSQYNEVLLLLPPSRHQDPRLLYTGLTRARERAVLITPALTTGLPDCHD